MDQIKPDIISEIRDLKASAEKANVMTPEIDKFIQEGSERLQAKILSKQKLTKADFAFMEGAKAMVEVERFLQHTLRPRFEAHPERHPGIEFAEVEKSLRGHPEAKASLVKMEESGGEPDVIGTKGGALVFGDCSAESPSGRRDLDYYQAEKMAEDFGVELMDEVAYLELQRVGKFDLRSWSWFKTPEVVLRGGNAFNGGLRSGGVQVDGMSTGSHSTYLGWRGVLRVPKA